MKLIDENDMNNDLISRSALKEAFKEAYAGITFSLIECNDLIDNAPTVDCIVNTIEVRPQGYWIDDEHGTTCSNCGELSYRWSNFCPKCGADMRGEKE